MKRPSTKKHEKPSPKKRKQHQIKQKSAVDVEKERKKEAREEKKREKNAQIVAGKAMAKTLFSAVGTSAQYSSDDSDDNTEKIQSLQTEVEELKAKLRAASERKAKTKVGCSVFQYDIIPAVNYRYMLNFQLVTFHMTATLVYFRTSLYVAMLIFSWNRTY